jgi:hypothetical protein
MCVLMIQMVKLKTQSRETIETKLSEARTAFDQLKQSQQRMYPVGGSPSISLFVPNQKKLFKQSNGF